MAQGLHERRRELAVVLSALDEAASGRGRALLLEGPAGIGKTSVLGVAREAARERGMGVAAARASDLERTYAWGVVRQLLEPRLRGATPAGRARLLAGAAGLAAPVVLPEAAMPPAPDDGSFGVLHGLHWLVAGLAAERPLVLLVDDLHWADAASLRFLAFLLARLDTLAVAVLGARRPPGGASDPLGGAPDATLLELQPLSAQAAAALLAERRGRAVDPALAAACHRATGGNPLLVRRLADGLGDEADAAAVDGRGPFAVAGAVRATLAGLGPAPSALALAAAVLGRTPLTTAAALAGLDRDEAAAAAERLVAAGLLRDDRPLEFEHPLVREAVLAGASAGRRAGLHAEAARLLADAGVAPDIVAVHLLRTEPRGDAGVAAALAAAGRRALGSGASDEAAALLERALAEPPPVADRSALLLDLAGAEHRLGRPEALDHALAAFDAAGDPVARGHAALAFGWGLGRGRQDPADAARLVERAVRELDGRDAELGRRLTATLYFVRSLSPELMDAMLGEPERFAGVAGETVGECELLVHAAVHRFLLGRSAAEVAELVERAVARPDVVAAIGPESAGLQFALGQLYKTDRLDAGRRAVGVALQEARRRGSAAGFAGASLWQAWFALRAGAAADAEADARAALYVAEPGSWLGVLAVTALVEVLVDRGATDEAQRVLEAAGGGGTAPADRGGEWLLSTRSILRAAQGDAAGALADQLDSRRRQGEAGALDPDFGGWLRIAVLLRATGDPAGAAREAEAALAWARGWGTPGHLGQALVASGLVRGGDEGLAQLRAAVEALERSPARRELANALVELGAALRRRGERVAAREPLRRALDLATAGGLVAIAERAREELRVSGAKVRRPEATGVGALTPSELRIVRLAAGGASNPEIAQSLFVTVKTVEMHLGRAYRKLGVGSRRQLPGLVGAAEEQGAMAGSSP